jgi:hypothetical protein
MLLDPEVLRHAAASVFHYFKKELERETVTVGEFAVAMEKVLRQLGFVIRAGALESRPREVVETDLCLFARESADSLELFFFPRLRDELRAQLRQSPRVLRFRGLRGCVKQLAGARRWSAVAKNCRTRSSNTSAAAFTAEPEQSTARWWWNEFGRADLPVGRLARQRVPTVNNYEQNTF